MTGTSQVQIIFDPYHNIDPCQKPCLTISVGDNMASNMIPSVSIGNTDNVFRCVHWIPVFYPLIIHVFDICKKEGRHLISFVLTDNKNIHCQKNKWMYLYY